jgi:seryl-tRNA synthetase
VRRAVVEVADLSISSYRFVPEVEPLWRRSPGEPAAAGVGRAALASFGARFLRPLGPGQWALVGPAASLRELLDRRIATMARAVGAEPWHLPSVESADDLVARVGYLASHGQHVTWGVHLEPRFESLRRFAADARAGHARFPGGHEARPTGFILEPVVCHNVYRALAGARLEAPLAITALGSCYRYEGFRFAPLLRHWEFSMREAVLLGDAATLADQRQRLVAATRALCDELDLGASLEIATDPFFVSEAGSARAFQAMQSTKLELRLDLDGPLVTAAASFNLHGSHFAEPMDLRDRRGELIDTACVGWGLERWMAAVVARWGAEPERWPAAALGGPI